MKFLTSAKWDRLEHLLVYDCNLGDDGIAELVKNDWPALTELHLCKSYVDSSE